MATRVRNKNADATPQTNAADGTAEPTTEGDIVTTATLQEDAVAASEGADAQEVAGAPTEAVEAEEVIDLTAIQNAAKAIVDGDLSDLANIDFGAVVEEYGKLSRKGKAAVTRDFNSKSKDLLEAGDFNKARVYLLAERATKAAAKTASAPKTPADPTENVVTRLAGFQLAYAALMENLPELPETSKGDNLTNLVKAAFDAGKPQVSAFVAWTKNADENKGDAPEVSPAAALATKIAFTSTRKPYGKRHDVTAHITQVFADKPAGTFMTVGEIAGASSEEYGDEKASPSAITARIGSDKALPEGLTAAERDGTKGILKS